MENHWGEVNHRELSTDAGCSEHPIPTKEAGGYNLCRAEPLVGAPGLILNVAWKYLHSEGGKARKSLAKST